MPQGRRGCGVIKARGHSAPLHPPDKTGTETRPPGISGVDMQMRDRRLLHGTGSSEVETQDDLVPTARTQSRPTTSGQVQKVHSSSDGDAR